MTCFLYSYTLSRTFPVCRVFTLVTVMRCLCAENQRIYEEACLHWPPHYQPNQIPISRFGQCGRIPYKVVDGLLRGGIGFRCLHLTCFQIYCVHV